RDGTETAPRRVSTKTANSSGRSP
ncbi:uncharacterized protein METZ01_LOCUS375203, partial [marine metagenome]